MNNRIPKKYENDVKSFLKRYKGTGKRLEMFTEHGVFSVNADSELIEIVDEDDGVIEIVEV
ncbi:MULTISPECIES: hypothetical protein [Brevibacillus]|jgi:hypothetical protein|uniref:hypothetical protein n=1 Tax=Paenibacillaceae TaxID=186822 RepID=UPI001E2E9B8D|nr:MULTISPECIES: hypothetical protein [Brevibacillus]MCE0450699.1 hypothetical protein [Brevibacillus sp. AF8]